MKLLPHPRLVLAIPDLAGACPVLVTLSGTSITARDSTLVRLLWLPAGNTQGGRNSAPPTGWVEIL